MLYILLSIMLSVLCCLYIAIDRLHRVVYIVLYLFCRLYLSIVLLVWSGLYIYIVLPARRFTVIMERLVQLTPVIESHGIIVPALLYNMTVLLGGCLPKNINFGS